MRRSKRSVPLNAKDDDDDDDDDDFVFPKSRREFNNNVNGTDKENPTTKMTKKNSPPSTDEVAEKTESPIGFKGPKKLVLKTKAKGPVRSTSVEDGTVKLVRGKNQREFVLFKSDNFNFSGPHERNRAAERRDLLHLLLGQETRGPAELPSSVLLNPLLDSVRPMRVFHNLAPFDRRATAIEWHPTNPRKVAVGSKGGEITILDVAKQDPSDEAIFLPGIGPGGSVGAMRFCPLSPEWLLTACLDSKVTLRNLKCDAKSKVLHDTGDWNKWFVSCDISPSLYAAGQSTGELQLFDRVSLSQVSRFKLHKAKISHVEFSKHHEYLLASASVNHEVKIWDVRKMESVNDKPEPLHILAHDAGVNVASFSVFNGQRLLTSDQYGQIRVYALPGFYLERSILHPHRQFQHLTPIKASWHPLQDLIVIGRWPDPDFVGYNERERRTIDIFDANSGKMKAQLFDPSLGGIISLNKFSNDGQFLCSGMSRNILLWGQSKDWDGDSPLSFDVEALLQTDLIEGRRRPKGGEKSKRGKTGEAGVKKGAKKGKRGGKDDDDDDVSKTKLKIKKTSAKSKKS